MHTANNPKELVDTLRSNRGGLSTPEAVDGIPPASAQTFLKSSAIPTVVLTNYNREFSNNMYHSIYDSADRHNYQYEQGERQKVVTHISKVSMMVAKTIIKLATGQDAPDMEDQSVLVNELLHCYTVTANCTMFHEASEPGNYPWIFAPESRRKTPFPQYVGVRSSYHTLMTKLALQYLTGTIEPLDMESNETPDITEAKANCLAKNSNQNVHHYVYLVGKGCYNSTGVECGKCYKTTVDTTDAASPAFLAGVKEDYDWSSGLYPTWTESIWKVISGRLFLQGSPAHDHGIFAMGIIILVVSLGAVFWLDKNSAIIFTKQKTVEVDNPVPVEM
jgi:nicastrin